jgi:hypothetical protein
MNKVNKMSSAKVFPVLILLSLLILETYRMIFYRVLFSLIVHHSFMLNPIHWIIRKKSLIQLLILLFRYQNNSYYYFYDFMPLFVRRGLSVFYSICELTPV